MSIENGQDKPDYIPYEEYALSSYQHEKQDMPWLIMVLTFGVFALSVVVFQGWEGGREGNRMFVPLFFMPDTATIAIDILTSLAVVTALMERAVEVFIGSTRAVKRKLCMLHHDALSDAIEELKKNTGAKLNAVKDEINALERRHISVKRGLTSYRTGTKIKALAFSLLFGTLIALAGVRVISPLLDVPYSAMSNIQWAALQIVDIAGTAGLIAGGTSGIHRLIRNIGARTEPDTQTALEVATRP